MKNLLCIVFYFIIIFYPLKIIMANIEAPSSRDSAEADITIDKSLILNLINQGKYEEAKRNLLVIIKKDEEDAEAYNLLGYIERQLQNYILAIKFYKRALAINNDFIGAHHYIAMAYLELDDIEKAKYHLNQLDLICLFGCEDYFEVKNKIKFYEANNG
ncbi:MAG: tetratricopeptide repeat protein [Alphaproteobacteria bacterium]